MVERVGWPFESTPTSTLTVRDTLETETSQLPESDICGLCTHGRRGGDGEGREEEERKRELERKEEERKGEGGKG